MNNSSKILLSFLGIVSLCSAPLHANERAVILSLTDGRRVCTKMSAVTAKGATFEENGSTQFASRAEIRMYTFPTVATAVLPRAEVKRAPEAQGKPEAKGELSSLLNSPVSDHDLPQLLQRPEVRAMFESLQGQLLGTLPSDENAAAARTKSRGIYDQLASGKLNIAGLTAMGQGVLKETDSYAKERQEAPQFDPLIAQLTSLLAGR